MKVLFWMFIGFDKHATSEHPLSAVIEQLCKAGHSVHIIQKDSGGNLPYIPLILSNYEVTTDVIPYKPAKKTNLKVILYAPTWRESTNGGKSYENKPPIHFGVWKKELGDEYVVLFRAHHQTTKVLGVHYDEFVREASSYPAVNDLMIAADIRITDYSAIAFDYSILCRPIFCYAYDYDTYLAERGTYFQIDEKYPNKSCGTEEELLRRIKGIDYAAECANTKRFRDEFVQYGIGATETCAKAEFGK